MEARMNLPPEPDPATAIACPCCGEPISPEGAAFLAESFPKKDVDSERELPNTSRMTSTATSTHPQQEIDLGHVILRILNHNQFEIDDSPRDDQGPGAFTNYGPYFVPDTHDMDAVLEVLKNPAWAEDQINDAVAALVRADHQESASEREDRRQGDRGDLMRDTEE